MSTYTPADDRYDAAEFRRAGHSGLGAARAGRARARGVAHEEPPATGTWGPGIVSGCRVQVSARAWGTTRAP